MNHKTLWRLRLKRFCLAAVVLAVTISLLLLFERVRGAMAFNARITDLTRNGERLKVAELEPVQAQPSKDAVSAMLALTNRIDAAASNAWCLMPPVGRVASPGKAVVASRLSHWSDKDTTNTWELVHRWLARDDALAGEIHEALLKPGWNDGFDYHKGFVDFRIGPLTLWKQTIQLLEIEALAALNEGRTDLAVDRVEDSLRLVRHQGNSPLVISGLVRIACAVITWHTCWEVVVSGQCNEAQLARLQAAWEGMDFSASMSHAMEMERAMTLDHYEHLISSPERLAKAVEEYESTFEFGFGPKWPTSGAILRNVHIPVWRFAWARQDQLRSLNRWQDVIEFDRQARTNSWRSVMAEASGMDDDMQWLWAIAGESDTPIHNPYDRLRFLFSTMTFSIGSGTTRKSLEAEAQRRLMITAIALRRHQLLHGKFPEQLEELTQKMLAAVPTDPMNGKQLRYQRLPDGSPLLYSVGRDGEDNGGNAEMMEGESGRPRLWNCRDAVWPAPATQEEAETAASDG